MPDDFWKEPAEDYLKDKIGKPFRALATWLGRKFGGRTFFGALYFLFGGVAFLKGGDQIFGVTEKSNKMPPVIARTANCVFLFGGLGMIGLQLVLQSRRKAALAVEAIPTAVLVAEPVLDVEEANPLPFGTFAEHGISLSHPPTWTVEPSPHHSVPGAWQFKFRNCGGTVRLQLFPGDVQAQVVNAVVKRLRNEVDKDLVCSPSSTHLGGQRALGVDFCTSDKTHSGQVLSALADGQTAVLYWQAAAPGLASFRVAIDQIRTSLEWAVPEAEAVPVLPVLAEASDSTVVPAEMLAPNTGVFNRTWVTVSATLGVPVLGYGTGPDRWPQQALREAIPRPPDPQLHIVRLPCLPRERERWYASRHGQRERASPRLHLRVGVTSAYLWLPRCLP
ncbi:MAG: hypothetical protein L0Y72_00080 [Gemmataceae bacterium]|nr:hypothetical protein [Gemmataceae bacterium]MCI0737407.1 hypothetical protein [Gemmataceae bacterium]